ncbi:Fpg/Nei family DNA glycosylase [Puniceicoccus vermicola]|uniref:Fpg/Nei family DNA glycosylase n=1 Tax=Puniceicoccus vermicola TaxID=388746 RepID=A0A7X1E3C8_9BACT|nr:Fpg/Nei family DNA glycosylase [Puniceicoccus vermicola]MBC2600936.1 Fpg/Nei family DNA glycosylase [Puniceicoccus vermicola]
MPELAEVEYYKRRWEPALGQTVQKIDLHEKNRVFRGTDTEDLTKSLTGSQFSEARAHGKQMLFRFGEEGWLGVHLGMAGKLFCQSPETFEPHKHDHLVIHLEPSVLIFRDTRYFGRILWHRGPEEPDWWTQAGRNLLDDDYTEEIFRESLRRRSKTPAKSLLLDQKHFPGIGNWMADEILWRAAVHPEKRGGQLSEKEISALYQCLREVCRDAMRVIAPDWSDPPQSWLFRHRWKDGGICPKTEKPLARIQVGGRTTCYSPARQGKAP